MRHDKKGEVLDLRAGRISYCNDEVADLIEELIFADQMAIKEHQQISGLTSQLAERDAEIVRLKKECTTLEDCRQATKEIVAETVRGFVEGRPTNTLNYLQRIRTLVAMEAKHGEELTPLREDVERWKKRATECVGIGTIIMFEEEDAALDAARGEEG